MTWLRRTLTFGSLWPPLLLGGARGGRQEMQLQRQTVDAHLMRIYSHVIHGYFYPPFRVGLVYSEASAH